MPNNALVSSIKPWIAVVLALSARAVLAQSPRTIDIETSKSLDPVNVTLGSVTFKGRKAVRMIAIDNPTSRAKGETMAIVTGVDFKEGIIELDLSGEPGPKAAPDDRGFIGLSFHIQAREERFQTFYLRPTNGRADDQLRRNHSTQYTVDPDWPWFRLRKEEPGKYESYVDMVAGDWTALKIVVSKTRAELFVNGAAQPALVVTDLKTQDESGGIALWIGNGTVGHFANLRISDTSR